MGTSPTLAATAVLDQTPQAICGGTADIKGFFRTMGFTGDFRVVATLRDEVLSRRYYRVKVEPSLVPTLREQLATKWIEGRMNRSVYENGIVGRVKRSRNLPKWWDLKDPPLANHLMLDHGGRPNWYVVLTDTGETCFMWVGH